MKRNQRVYSRVLPIAAIGIATFIAGAVAASVASPNLAKMEMEGVQIENDVVVVQGPGWKVDRSKSYSDGKPLYSPEAAQEQNLIIEMSGADATRMKTYFDTHLLNRKRVLRKAKKGKSGHGNAANAPIKSASLIVRNSGGSEVYRWNLFDFKPHKLTRVGGKTRFEFRQAQAPDNNMQYVVPRGYVTGNEGSRNPAKDVHFEIAGYFGSFYPEVQVNRSANTITMTYDHNEGRGLYRWLKNVVSGKSRRQVVADGSIIQLNSAGKESSRENFFGLFPIEFKVMEGVGRSTQTKIRVVLSYNFSE
ncbi:MAG: hypothetical protein GY854_21640 [Deltaproteobacteria bacterium]|nr:hypothetical protein [Deltaproteobacteria bacterium]